MARLMVVSAQLYNSFFENPDHICRVSHSGIIAKCAKDSFCFLRNSFGDKGLTVHKGVGCRTSEDDNGVTKMLFIFFY